jgi:quinol monooxygenase YgiN
MVRLQEKRISKGMFRSTIRMLIPLGKQSEALEILASVSEQTRCNPSCINSGLYRGVEEIRAILLDELWTSKEEGLRHLQSEEYRRVLLVVEMAEERPEIRFDTIVQSRGVEFIEMARSQL